MGSALRWDGTALELLDQRRLPLEERWLSCRTVEQVVDAISDLAVRGAPCIALAAAYGLALAVGPDESAPAARERVRAAAEGLAAARPTAVNLRWAMERSMRRYERVQCDESGTAADALVAAARSLEAEQAQVDSSIARLGLPLLSPGDRVLTHCNTGPIATGAMGTAGGMLVAGHAAGLVRHVWVNETRPLLQGARLTAWELGRADVPFKLVTDGSVGALMSHGLVDAIVVGADRVAANGDVANKIGTYVVAALADRHNVPFYVAAPTSTIDTSTANGAEIPIEERSPDEVTGFGGTKVAPAGAGALNLAFDVTPAELVTAIVTEHGVLEPPLERAIAWVS